MYVTFNNALMVIAEIVRHSIVSKASRQARHVDLRIICLSLLSSKKYV